MHLHKEIAEWRILWIKAKGKGERHRKTEIVKKSRQGACKAGTACLYNESWFNHQSPSQYSPWRRSLDIGKRPLTPPIRKPLHLQMESLQTVQPQCREARPQEKELHDRLVWSPGQVHNRQKYQWRKSYEKVRWYQPKKRKDCTRQNENEKTGNPFRGRWLHICQQDGKPLKAEYKLPSYYWNNVDIRFTSFQRPALELVLIHWRYASSKQKHWAEALLYPLEWIVNLWFIPTNIYPINNSY